MKFIFFDFETDGIGAFPKQKAIQLAWYLHDTESTKKNRIKSYYFDNVTKINTNFHKDLSVSKIRKISTSSKLILQTFLEDVKEVMVSKGLIVAHNIQFDFKILVNECIRDKIICDWDTMWKYCFCTMKSTKDLCNIPRSHGGGAKYPRLEELYTYLYKEPPNIKLHEASNDVEVLWKCWDKLQTNYTLNLSNNHVTTN